MFHTVSYIEQVVSRISEPSTVSRKHSPNKFWRQFSPIGGGINPLEKNMVVKFGNHFPSLKKIGKPPNLANKNLGGGLHPKLTGFHTPQKNNDKNCTDWTKNSPP